MPISPGRVARAQFPQPPIGIRCNRSKRANQILSPIFGVRYLPNSPASFETNFRCAAISSSPSPDALLRTLLDLERNIVYSHRNARPATLSSSDVCCRTMTCDSCLHTPPDCCETAKINPQRRLQLGKLQSSSAAASLTTHESSLITREHFREGSTDGRMSAADAVLTTNSWI